MAASDNNLSRAIEEARAKFNAYAETQKFFQMPEAHIHIEEQPDDRTSVHIEVQYNGIDFHFKSVEEKDIDDVYNYLNSQPLVREKYLDGKTVSLDKTIDRMNTLIERFRNKNSPHYLYSAFVVYDAQTETFLGVANMGAGPDPGTAEIARLNRVESWGHAPEIKATYNMANVCAINKTYSGIGTVETCTLLQYAARLKKENYKINGHPLKAVISFARVDNEGSWKSNAKAGMTLEDVEIVSYYGKHLRYKLQKNM